MNTHPLANKKNIFFLLLLTGKALLAHGHNKWLFCLKGGVSPSWYSSSASLKGVGLNSSNAQIIADFFTTSSFKERFKTPWIIQGEVGRQCSHNINFMVDASFMKAEGRSVKNPFYNSKQLYSSLDISQLRLGMRTYGFTETCINPYIGFNVGLQFRSSVKFTTPDIVNDTVQFNGTLFSKDVVPAGAIHLGAAGLIGKGFSINIYTEVSFASSFKNNNNYMDIIQQQEPTLTKSVVFLTTGTFISLPVTFGLAYNF